jgi:DNA-binding NtrC family response regulator
MAMAEKILIVDDDEGVRLTLSEALAGWDYTVFEAGDYAAATSVFERERPALLLVDVGLPDGDGLGLLEYVKRSQPNAVAIVTTAGAEADDTTAALTGGAYDFVAKPINLAELRVAIRNGLEARDLRCEIARIRRERPHCRGFEGIVGESPPIRQVIELARKVALSDTTSVLLQGESGTGKDVLARAIHYASSRADEPFVPINCAAIPASLLESELFGYERGAFTDAKQRKEGLFEQARDGTLFLDEIGDLDRSLQTKLLRVLEEGAFRRVGGLKEIDFDVRVIAASNNDLRADADAGRFRKDLYYRLAVIQIEAPPLRERGDDVLLLARSFLDQFESIRSTRWTLSQEAAEALKRYPWPGNVRELRNAIERAVILEEGDVITTRYLPVARPAPPVPKEVPPMLAASLLGMSLPPGGLSLESIELHFVREALTKCSGNQTRAAALLGISRDQLRYRLKRIEEQASRGAH